MKESRDTGHNCERSTHATTMKSDDDSIARNRIERLVVLILERSVENLEPLCVQTTILLRSLVLPFVARKLDTLSQMDLSKVIKSFKHTARILSLLRTEDDRDQDFIKYWTNFYMCKVMKDDQREPRKDWIITNLFSGWCLRMVNRAIAQRDLRFIYSLAKGSKQSWPSLGEVKERQALIKNRDALSRPRRVLDATFQAFLRRITYQVFAGKQHYTKMLPTGSSCLQASLNEGGTMSLVEPFQPSEYATSPLGKLRQLNLDFEQWRRSTNVVLHHKAGSRLFIRENEEDDIAPAEVVEMISLPEPGKFRIISKMDGYVATALQPLQGVLLSKWKKTAVGTMREEDLTPRIQALSDASTLPYFCSGDYSSATDLQLSHCSLIILDMLKSMGYKDIELARASMHRKVAIYPKKFGIPPALCEEGQLMGHPLSFPMLCTVNYAVYRLTLHRWVHECDPDTHLERMRIYPQLLDAVVINGDDILFKCDEQMYSLFLEVSKLAGFEVSIGKNYLSRDMCMINSQTFFLRGQRSTPSSQRGGFVTRMGYLNQRLVYGSSSKEEREKCLPTQIGTSINKMVQYCPWSRHTIPLIMKRWNYDFGYQPNWFLPVHLGGFGINPEFAEKVKLSRSQRIVASKFIGDPKLALLRVSKVGRKLITVLGSTANYAWAPFGPLPENTSDNILDWEPRLAMMTRASGQRETSEKIFVKKFLQPWRSRVTPMSVETIEYYRTARVVAHETVPCPPLQLLKLDY